MPQLLIEFFSEEIPARMQKRAEEDLARLLAEKLRGAGLEAKAIRTFSSPRRLGAVVDELPAKAADVNEERKGPRVGAPDAAVQGFLKSAGLSSIDQAQVVEDKRGAFYVARIERTGRATPAIVQEIVPEIVRGFPWPKSMRSGESDLTWVRPLHNVLCLFDGAPVKIAIDGVGSKPETWGHRFHAPAPIKVKDFADYAAKLRDAKVLIDREERKALILEQAKKLCAGKKLELVEDAGLLEEVAGLAEWPVVLMGDMDAGFLDLPGEVIRLSMRTHQKYFAVRDLKSGSLAAHFVVVANVEAKDGGKAIAAGNARVLSARLNDARFFWETDRKTPLYTEARVEKLKQIVFHQKLGSVWDKVERVKALAVELCAVTGADVKLVERAALLCKMDLVTETVGEFPELQGQVGRALAELAPQASPLAGEAPAKRAEGGRANTPTLDHSRAPPPPPPPPPRGGGVAREHPSIAVAIEDHYRPLGPNDRVPSDPVAVTLALADKLDTLVGFWAINERPTGSSDPYALRRAALGVVRILLQSRSRIGLSSLFRRQYEPKLVEAARGLGLLFEEYVRRAPSPEGLRYLINELRGGYSAFCFAFDGLLDVSERRLLPVKEDDEDASDEYFETARGLAARGALLERHSDAVLGCPDDKGVITLDTGQKVQLDAADSERARRRLAASKAEVEPLLRAFVQTLVAFLADRLKVQLRDQGKRYDLVDAVFALGDDDLVRIVARVEALDQFLRTEDGANLLAGSKRAANILAAEEKKGRGLSDADLAKGLDPKLLKEPAEQALHAALEQALPAARAGVEKEDFAAAMKALSRLRAPVDAFFDQVLVNAEDTALRRNRLLLLSRFREALSQVADFSKIEG